MLGHYLSLVASARVSSQPVINTSYFFFHAEHHAAQKKSALNGNISAGSSVGNNDVLYRRVVKKDCHSRTRGYEKYISPVSRRLQMR